MNQRYFDRTVCFPYMQFLKDQILFLYIWWSETMIISTVNLSFGISRKLSWSNMACVKHMWVWETEKSSSVHILIIVVLPTMYFFRFYLIFKNILLSILSSFIDNISEKVPPINLAILINSHGCGLFNKLHFRKATCPIVLCILFSITDRYSYYYY